VNSQRGAAVNNATVVMLATLLGSVEFYELGVFLFGHKKGRV
jgi:hypothetical protein